jgi:hypothetical protein
VYRLLEKAKKHDILIVPDCRFPNEIQFSNFPIWIEKENQNENNIAPSLSDLEKLTELPKRTIQAAKRELDKEGFIKTEGNKTFVVAEKELN